MTSPLADPAAGSAAVEVGFAGQQVVECCGECFAVVEAGFVTGRAATGGRRRATDRLVAVARPWHRIRPRSGPDRNDLAVIDPAIGRRMRRGGRTTPALGHSPSLSNTITPGPQPRSARPATGLRRRPIQAPRITKQLAHLRNQPIQRHGRQYVRSPPQPANTSPTFTRRPELGVEGSRQMLTRDSPRYAESSTACSVSSKPRAGTLPSQRPRHALGYDPESYLGGPAPTAGPRILRPARTPLCACSTPPRSAADRTQHPRSRSARAIAVRPRSRPGPYDALRAAPGSAALRLARSSTFRENIGPTR